MWKNKQYGINLEVASTAPYELFNKTTCQTLPLLRIFVISTHKVQVKCIWNHGYLFPHVNIDCIHLENASTASYLPFKKPFVKLDTYV
jgi:hypothetical protein